MLDLGRSRLIISSILYINLFSVSLVISKSCVYRRCRNIIKLCSKAFFYACLHCVFLPLLGILCVQGRQRKKYVIALLCVVACLSLRILVCLLMYMRTLSSSSSYSKSCCVFFYREFNRYAIL